MSQHWRAALIGAACLLAGSSGCEKQAGNELKQPPRIDKLQFLYIGQSLDVFLDNSRQPFLKGARFDGSTKIGGEKFLRFSTPGSVRYVNPSRIVYLKSSEENKPEDVK